MESIINIINNILVEEGLDPIENPSKNYHLKNDLGLDSLSLALLTVKIEDEFGIDVFEDGLVFTVQEIYDKINRQ